MEKIDLGDSWEYVGIEGFNPAQLWDRFKVIAFYVKDDGLAVAVADDELAREKLDHLSFVLSVNPKRFVADIDTLLKLTTRRSDTFNISDD